MKQSYNNHITTDLTNLDWKSFEMPKTSPLTVSALKQIPDIHPITMQAFNNNSHSPQIRYEKNNNTQHRNNRATHIIEQRDANRIRQAKNVKPKGNLIFTH